MYHNIIIDGSNLMMSGISMNTEDFLENGMYVGGVTSILRSISKLVYRLSPDYIYITFDYYKSQFRLDLYPEYKGKRKLPQDVAYRATFNRMAIDILEKVLPLLGVYVIKSPVDVEADDVISNFVKQSKNHNTIISTDKDFIQLIDDKTSLYRQVDETFISKETVDGYLGYNSEYMASVKALVGDVSDNIIGCKLVGEKTGIKIVVNSSNEVASILSYCSSSKSKWARNVEEFIKSGEYQLNLQLVDLKHGPQFSVKELIQLPNYDFEKATKYLIDLGFNDILGFNDWKWIVDWAKQQHEKHKTNS
jgi:DNA polymerase-1